MADKPARITKKELASKTIKIMYHATEIVFPLSFSMIGFTIPKISQKVHETVPRSYSQQVGNGKSLILVLSLPYLILNSVAHGCYGLYSEIKPSLVK